MAGSNLTEHRDTDQSPKPGSGARSYQILVRVQEYKRPSLLALEIGTQSVFPAYALDACRPATFDIHFDHDGVDLRRASRYLDA
jgi:hypothetical protein